MCIRDSQHSNHAATPTSLLTVASAKHDTKARIMDKSGELIESESELKMLGYMFSEQPTVQKQIEYLVRKANKKFYVLIHYKKAGINKDRLKDIYTSLIRIRISNVYHPQLNKGNANLLEKVQRKALKAIYGYDKDYTCLLYTSPSPRD